MSIPKIGQKNPAAVLRDVAEEVPKLKSLVAIGIYEDGSADIWSSQTPDQIEIASVILQSHCLSCWLPDEGA